MVTDDFIVKVLEYNHQPNINVVNGLEIYKFCLERIVDKHFH